MVDRKLKHGHKKNSNATFRYKVDEVLSGEGEQKVLIRKLCVV
jgi:hypothetical protein